MLHNIGAGMPVGPEFLPLATIIFSFPVFLWGNFNIHHRKIERHLLSDEKNGDPLGISEQFLLMKCAVSLALF